MMISHGRVLTVTVSIALILRNRSVAANFGREEKMTEQERQKMLDDLKAMKKVPLKSEVKCIQEPEPPRETIKLADWLIGRGLKDGICLYGKSDLRKLANYLLIYCGDEND